MALEKKTLPTQKSDNKPEATATATSPKAGKPSADVNASDSVTPSFTANLM